jgi:hypothetical protein
MAAAKRRRDAEMLDSGDDSIDSESEQEDVSSDFEESGSDDSVGTVTYDATSDFPWCERPCDEPSRLNFAGSSGRKAEISDVTDVLEYFRLFLTVDMLEMIITETNRRAGQILQGPQKPQSRMGKWTDVDQDEILVFISILIYMGIIHKPELEMYWTTNLLLETPYIAKIMTEKRFSMIMKCLHFVNNFTLPETFSHPGEKSFSKIKPFFSAVIHQFSTVYIPEQNIAVDESLMLWKGRLAMKQYIPLKRARFGLKSYELCECGSGYIWNSIVHTGPNLELDESNDMLTSSRIVLTLTKELLGKGYTLYMDNWYSSPALYRQLRSNQTDALGTVRLNRKHMPVQLKKKVAKGQTIALYSTDLMALKWMDKREVSILSTFHGSEMTTVRTFRGNKEKPVAVVAYNKHMGAIDLADQMLTAYPAERKRRKVWYKKQFCHLLNQIVLNSYILFKKDNTGTKLNHLQFRIKLVERILETHHQPIRMPKRGRPSLDDSNPLRLTGRHFPKMYPPSEGKQTPTRRCKVCCSHTGTDGKKVRKETRYFCSECDAALCVSPCFETYHTKLNY